MTVDKIKGVKYSSADHYTDSKSAAQVTSVSMEKAMDMVGSDDWSIYRLASANSNLFLLYVKKREGRLPSGLIMSGGDQLIPTTGADLFLPHWKAIGGSEIYKNQLGQHFNKEVIASIEETCFEFYVFINKEKQARLVITDVLMYCGNDLTDNSYVVRMGYAKKLAEKSASFMVAEVAFDTPSKASMLMSAAHENEHYVKHVVKHNGPYYKSAVISISSTIKCYAEKIMFDSLVVCTDNGCEDYVEFGKIKLDKFTPSELEAIKEGISNRHIYGPPALSVEITSENRAKHEIGGDIKAVSVSVVK